MSDRRKLKDPLREHTNASRLVHLGRPSKARTEWMDLETSESSSLQSDSEALLVRGKSLTSGFYVRDQAVK